MRARSSTAQESPTQAFVTHRHRRRASYTDRCTHTDIASAETLARIILRQARAELSSQNIDARGFTYEHFKPFLPAETDNERILRIFRLWVTEPLLVPDSDLRKVLRYQSCVKGSPRMRQTTVCYFRSWTMTSKQLRTLLSYLEEQKYFFEAAQYWMNVIRGTIPGKIITIRYVAKLHFQAVHIADSRRI